MLHFLLDGSLSTLDQKCTQFFLFHYVQNVIKGVLSSKIKENLSSVYLHFVLEKIVILFTDQI